MSDKTQKLSNRIDIIDALRGLAILLMVIHHALYDAVYYLGAPAWFFANPVFTPLSRFFEVVFILLSGASCRFSHSNLKRGVIFLAGAVAISAVTYFIGNPIRFGILHFLGVAAVGFGLYQKLREHIKTPTLTRRQSDTVRALAILTCAAAFALLWNAIYHRTYSFEGFGWMGFTYPGYSSSDWFPILPWIFVYIAGNVLGLWITEHRFPERFYTQKVPFFAAAGRHTLWIYLLHQPILYGITMLIQYIVMQ